MRAIPERLRDVFTNSDSHLPLPLQQTVRLSVEHLQT